MLKLADFGLLVSAAAHLSRLGTVRYMPPDGRMFAPNHKLRSAVTAHDKRECRQAA
jgi:hypothetical protein